MGFMSALSCFDVAQAPDSTPAAKRGFDPARHLRSGDRDDNPDFSGLDQAVFAQRVQA